MTVAYIILTIALAIGIGSDVITTWRGMSRGGREMAPGAYKGASKWKVCVMRSVFGVATIVTAWVCKHYGGYDLEPVGLFLLVAGTISGWFGFLHNVKVI